MERAQVFLRDDQKKSLRSIAASTGRKQSDLIRSGVDLIIENEQKKADDWKLALLGVRGIWEGRDDFQDQIRSDVNQRFDRLFSE